MNLELFGDETPQKYLPVDAQLRLFIDRDGALFKYILDALRQT